jgi:hypothetical protein
LARRLVGLALFFVRLLREGQGKRQAALKPTQEVRQVIIDAAKIADRLIEADGCGRRQH